MANDRLGMLMEINFEPYEKVNAKLESLLKRLQKANKLNIEVDTSTFEKLEKQFNQLKEKISKNVGISIDNSALSGLSSAMDKLDKKQIKIVDKESVQLIEQSKKSLLETQKIITNLKSGSQTVVNTTDYSKAQTDLYKQLNTLQSQEFSLKQKMIGQEGEIKTQLQGQIDLIKQQQTEIGKLINQNSLIDNSKNNNILSSRKVLMSDLSIAQEKYNSKVRLEKEETDKQIKNYKDLMNIKIQNLQSKYGGLVNKGEVEGFKNLLNNITSSNFNKGEISNEFARIEANVKASSNALKLTQRDAQSLGDTLKNDIQKFGLWMVSGTVIMQGFKFFTDGVKYVNELNKSLTEIAIVTNKTQSEVRQLGFEYANLAKEMSVSTKEIATASVEFYRQGLSQNEVMERLKTTTQYAKISNLDFKQSAEILTATVNSMGVSIENASDVFAYLGDATATGADEIGVAMAKVAGTTSVAGVSLEKMASWIAEISSKTRESAETIGFSMQSILSRYMQIKESGFNEEDSTKINDVVKALSSVGIKATDAKGQLLPFANVLDSLGERFKSLDKNAQAYILTTLAGTRQSSRLANLLNSYSDSVKLYEGAMQSANTTTSKYNIWLEGTEAHLNQLKLAGTNIWQSVFNSKDIKVAIDALTGLVNGIGSIVKVVGNLPTLIGITTFAFSMFNKQLLSNNIFTFAKGFTLLPKLFTITNTATGVATTKMMLFGTVLDLTKVKAFGLQVVVAGLQAVLTMGLSFAIVGIVSALSKMINSSKEAEQSMKDLMASLPQKNQEFRDISNLAKQLEELTSKTNKTVSENEKLIDIQRQLAQSFPQLVDGFDSEGKALVKNVDSVKEVIAEKKKLLELENRQAANKAKQDLPKTQSEINKVEKELEKNSQLIEKWKKQLKDTEDGVQTGLSVSKLKEYIKETEKDNIKLIKSRQDLQKTYDDEKTALNIIKQIYADTIREKLKSSNTSYSDDTGKAIANQLVKEMGFSEEILNEVLNEQRDTFVGLTSATDSNTKSNQSNVNSVEDMKQKHEALNKAFDESTNKLEAYNKYQSELRESHKLSADSLQEVIEKYPELLAYVGNESAMRGKLTELIKSEEEAQRQAYINILSNSEEFYNAKIKGNVEMQNQINGLLAKFVDAQGNAYQVDFNNYKTMEEMKGSVSTQLIKNLAGAWASYWDATMQGFSNEFYYGMRYDIEGTQKARAIEQQIKDIINSLTNIGVSGINFDSIKVDGISSKDLQDQAKKAEQARNEAYQAIEDINSKLMSAIREQVEAEKKALDERLSNYRTFIEDKLKALDDEYEKEDRQRTLADENKKKADLQSQLNELMLDNSQEAKAKRAEIQKLIDEQQQRINDLNRDYQREDQKANLQDQLAEFEKQIQSQKDAIDEKYSDAEIAKLAKSGLLTGMVQIGNTTMSVKQILLDAMQRSGEAFEITGQKIQTELIDKLLKVQELLKNMNTNGEISGGVALDILGSHAGGAKIYQDGLYQLHANEWVVNQEQGNILDKIVKNDYSFLKNFKTIIPPSFSSQTGGRNVTVSFESLIGTINGNMDDSMFTKVKDFVKNEIPKIVADSQLNNDKKIGSFRPRTV